MTANRGAEELQICAIGIYAERIIDIGSDGGKELGV